MKSLVLFLVALSSACFSLSKYILGIIFLSLSIIIFLKKIKDKKWLLIYLTLFILIFIISYLYSFIPNFTDFFLIIDRRENYAIIFNGVKFYYLNVKNNNSLDIFDIVKVTGEVKELSFTVLESQFNFKEYLYSKGVEEELVIKNVEIVFNFPFNFYFRKVNFLSSIENENVKNFVSGLLFSNFDYSDKNFQMIKDLQIISLFSASGIYMNLVLYGVKNIFELHFKEKTSYIVSFFIGIFLFSININRFITIKVFIFFIVNFINKFYLDKRFKRIEIISLIGTIFIIIFPRFILQNSFQISFLVSIFLFFMNKIKFSKKKLEAKLITNFFIFLILIPFNLIFSSSINIFSFLISLFLLPLSKALYILNLVSFTFSFNNLIVYIDQYFLNIVSFFSEVKLVINIPKFNEIYLVIYYGLFLLIIFYKEINFKKFYRFSVFLFTSFLIIYSFPVENSLSYQISFINVGQGDSTLIRIKNEAYLIDTGGLTYLDVATNSLIPYLKKNRIYSLESVFITHYDYDHYGALENLKNNFQVKSVYDYSNFNNFISSTISLTNLNADYSSEDEENDKSLVLYTQIKDKYFLFMGDATSTVEKRIMSNYKNLKVDYLKVGHHGSKTSSTLEFLKFTNPEIAIISCGKNNKYGHPNEEVLKNLEDLNIEVHRTDLEGTITYKFF